MKEQENEFITLTVGGKSLVTIPKTEAIKNLKSGGIYEVGEFKEVMSKDLLLKTLKEHANKDLLSVFEEAIVNNTSLTYDSKNIERVSGKTRAMLYLAIKYDLPLVAATNMKKRSILHMEGIFSSTVTIISNSNGQKYLEGMGKVLVDEADITSLEAKTIIGILK